MNHQNLRIVQCKGIHYIMFVPLFPENFQAVFIVKWYPASSCQQRLKAQTLPLAFVKEGGFKMI
jgi:hypothetical protein